MVSGGGCFNPKLSIWKSALANFILIGLQLVGLTYEAQLRVGFYSKTCPAAETTVRGVVRQAVAADPGAAARLLRLHFHDCFIQGCDASILLRNENDDEMKARGNAGVDGFGVIQEAKTELETHCPGVVSCADIVALAARDAVVLAKGAFYEVPTGRRDGRIANSASAENLPDVDDSIQVLKTKFRQKGLSDQDLVLLSGGAHTVGRTACFFVQRRLYNFTSSGGSDPSINPGFLPKLKARCPFGGDVNIKIPLDWGSELRFDDQILRNIKNGFAVIASDARLLDDEATRRILNMYLQAVQGKSGSRASSFVADFGRAMVRMGNIDVKTGSQGEIRRICNMTNE